MRDNAAALAAFRDELADALADGDQQAMLELAAEMIARFGAMPGRGPGLSSWSAYTAMQRVAPSELVDRIVQALMAEGRLDDEARREAGRRMGGFTAMVEADARRRIAEEKGPEHVANVAIKPSIDRLDFTAARRSDLEQMRREIYPLARRLATRLTQEHHAKRRGPLDFRRTVRASMSTGGVPLTTHHKPKRPHRTELVVLCDVSGSVANFAQFTLLLVYALRDQFEKVRAFTFIDHVHEVTEHFVPGADPADVLTELAAAHLARRAVGPHQLRPGAAEVRGEPRRRARPQVVAADPRRRPLQLQRPPPRRAEAAGRRRPGTRGGSTPSTGGTGTPATPPRRSTARSCRWSSAATSPSSGSSCTTSSERRVDRAAVSRQPMPRLRSNDCWLTSAPARGSPRSCRPADGCGCVERRVGRGVDRGRAGDVVAVAVLGLDLRAGRRRRR